MNAAFSVVTHATRSIGNVIDRIANEMIDLTRIERQLVTILQTLCSSLTIISYRFRGTSESRNKMEFKQTIKIFII